MPSLDAILALLTHYGYFLLFLLAIVEGPIVTVIAAFLASQGHMNLLFLYLVVVGADVVGDSLFYSLGRWKISFIKKYGGFFGVNDTNLRKAEAYYLEHHHKTIVVSKVAHGIGVVGLVAAGALKVPYIRFFRTAIVVSILQSAVFVILGFFLGHAYATVGRYLNYFVATTTLLILASLAAVVIYKIKKNVE